MAEGGEDDSQKTEEPTPKRLEEARKKGQVAVSRELNNWLMLLTATIIIGTASPHILSSMTEIMRNYIEHAHAYPEVPGSFSIVLGQGFFKILALMAIPLIFLMIAAFLGPFLQIGFLLSTEVLKMDLSKISLMKGVSRLFSKRSLMEFAKGIFKLSVVGLISYLILKPYFFTSEHFIGLSAVALLEECMTMFLKLMTGILIVLAVLAGIDIVYQRVEHYKKMRMTKQELKDEYKQSEGDPKIKGRLRQLRAERARQRMMQSVPKADVVITNPTHYAIALEYKSEKMDAPVCVAKGLDATALRIREVAQEHKVTIYENPTLARTLYKTVEVDQQVPPEHYKAVAEVISYVFKLKGNIR